MFVIMQSLDNLGPNERKANNIPQNIGQTMKHAGHNGVKTFLKSQFEILCASNWRCKNTALMFQKKSDLGWISKWAQSQKQETYRTTSLPYYPKCKTLERLWPQCVLYRCCHHCDFYDRYCCFCCRILYCKFNTFLWKKTRQKDFYIPSVLTS